MNINTSTLRRPGFLIAAIAVALASLVPVLSQLVNADQVSSRSIQLSDSTPSHTNTSYQVTFTPTTAGAQSMVIDFCSNSSIIGGLCNAPGGMIASTPTFTSGGSATTGWQLGTGSASTVKITNGSGSALGTSQVTFTLGGITNPSATGTFWARIYTYSNTTYGTPSSYTDPQNLGSYVDYGGVALSTVSLINISATVMETLTFCVNKTQPGNGCTTLTTPVNLTLGHGTPQVLDSTQADTDDAYFQISTNALTGAVVRMKSHNTCSGLSRNGGTDSCPIAGIGGTTANGGSSAAIAAATAQFGLRVADPSGGAGGTGTVNATSPYNGAAASYGMDGNATTGVTSTYGSQIADTNSTATANVNKQMTFAAQASVTTPAGVYTANESLIATGTF